MHVARISGQMPRFEASFALSCESGHVSKDLFDEESIAISRSSKQANATKTALAALTEKSKALQSGKHASSLPQADFAEAAELLAQLNETIAYAERSLLTELNFLPESKSTSAAASRGSSQRDFVPALYQISARLSKLALDRCAELHAKTDGAARKEFLSENEKKESALIALPIKEDAKMTWLVFNFLAIATDLLENTLDKECFLAVAALLAEEAALLKKVEAKDKKSENAKEGGKKGNKPKAVPKVNLGRGS